MSIGSYIEQFGECCLTVCTMLFVVVRTICATAELSAGQYIWHSVLQDKALDNEQHTRHQLLCAGYGEALTWIIQGVY
jgi:hypothetical protein